jgi:hypothetical protein
LPIALLYEKLLALEEMMMLTFTHPHIPHTIIIV